MIITKNNDRGSSVDVKRFYVPCTARGACPKCQAPFERDFEEHYLSYPTMNSVQIITLYCEKCEHEWGVPMRLDVTLTDATSAADDNPIIHNFVEGLVAEKAHQTKRWGTVHDRNKPHMEWFWLIGYLAGKGLSAALKGDYDKAMHHCISTAAVCAQWHDAINGGHHNPDEKSDLEKALGE